MERTITAHYHLNDIIFTALRTTHNLESHEKDSVDQFRRMRAIIFMAKLRDYKANFPKGNL